MSDIGNKSSIPKLNHIQKTSAFAEKLHDNKSIYKWFSSVDGLNLSYSSIKYFFDLQTTDSLNSASDVMHEGLSDPIGLIIAASISGTLVLLSYLGNLYEGETDGWRKYLGTLWPYFRDVLKSLKNVFKGLRNAFITITLITGLQLSSFLLLAALVVGITAVLNRFLIRYIINERKEILKLHIRLYLLLTTSEKFKQEALDHIRDLNNQKILTVLNKLGYFSTFYAALFDGLYLYLGLLTICRFTAFFLNFMSVLAIIFYLNCLITRLYEEYEAQRKIKIYHKKVDMQLIIRQIEHNIRTTQECEAGDYKQLIDCFKSLLKDLEESNYLIILAGLRQGLLFYGVLATFTFALSTCLGLASIALPMIIPVIAACLGLISLISFTIYSFKINKNKSDYLHEFSAVLSNITDLETSLEDQKELIFLAKQFMEPDKDKILDSIEVARSLFSGITKGPKAIDLVCNQLQEQNNQGHYQSVGSLTILSVLSAIFHAIIFALRGIARGFGRIPMDKTGKANAYQLPADLIYVSDDDKIIDKKEQEVLNKNPDPKPGFFADPKTLSKNNNNFSEELSLSRTACVV